MTYISPKQPDCRGSERLAELLSAHAVHLEAFVRLLRRPFRASGRLSASSDQMLDVAVATHKKIDLVF